MNGLRMSVYENIDVLFILFIEIIIITCMATLSHRRYGVTLYHITLSLYSPLVQFPFLAMYK